MAVLKLVLADIEEMRDHQTSRSQIADVLENGIDIFQENSDCEQG